MCEVYAIRSPIFFFQEYFSLNILKTGHLLNALVKMELLTYHVRRLTQKYPVFDGQSFHWPKA